MRKTRITKHRLTKHRKKIIIGSLAIVFSVLAIFYFRQEKGANPIEWGLPADSKEIVSARTPQAKHFQNKDGTRTALFAHQPIHYTNKKGGVEEIELQFIRDKDQRKYVSEKNFVVTEVTDNTLTSRDSSSGKGISWIIPSNFTVKNNEATYEENGITWKYELTPLGTKLTAEVTEKRGFQKYSYMYNLVGDAKDLQIDTNTGSLNGDGFTIPRSVIIGNNGIHYTASIWEINEDSQISFTFDDSNLPPSAFPYIIDPTTEFVAINSSDYGKVERTSASFPPTGSGTTMVGGTHMTLNYQFSGGNYTVSSGLVRWDTSSIPDTATITSASYVVNLGAHPNLDSVTLQGEWYDSENWPIDSSDYAYPVGSTAFTELVPGAGTFYWPISLSNVTNINKAGYTGMRMGLTNATSPTNENYIELTAHNNGINNPSILIVNYDIETISDPIAHWKLDEPSGSTANDAQNNHNGTISGGVTLGVSGQINSAYTLNGSTGHVAITNHPSLQLSNGTISAWVKSASPGSSYRGIITKQTAYGLFLKDGVLMLYDWGSSNDRTTGVNIADDTWHHVTLTFQSGVSNGTKVYIDGELALTTTMSIAGQSSGISIGSGDESGTIQNFAGSIDDVRIYDRLLSEAEIQALYEYTGWYDNDWNKRVKITINSSQVAGDVADFPVYVDLSDLPSDFHTYVNQTDARDIRVTTSDGATEVAREIVFYDSGTDTGELHFKAPSLSTTSNTDFYIYYGNPTATEPAAHADNGSQHVWSNGYVASYHFQDNTSGQTTDSTATNATGTLNNLNSGDLTTAKLGNGFSLNGVDQNITAASTFGLGASNVTISGWVNLPDTGGQSGAFVKIGNDASGYGIGVGSSTFDDSGNDAVMLYEMIRWIDTNSTYGTGWRYFTMTIDESNLPRAYKDGSLINSFSGSNPLAPTGNITSIGGYIANGTENRFGLYTLDEIRISNTTRTANWIQTEYNNQNSPATFLSIGTTEEKPDTWYNNDWSKRVKVTVKSSQVADDVADFPVYVDLSDLPSDFHTYVNQTDARDIRVTIANGTTEVPREVVFYDSGTDTGELHFQAPTLSATYDTNFYIYYGNPSATEPAASATYGSQNVWNEDYVFVSHDGGVSDSTSNVYTATNNNSSINIAGKLGSSRDYNGTNSYTSLPNITSEFSTNATITAWTKLNIATPITDTQTGIWWFGNSSTNNTHYVWSDGTAYMATFRNVRVESIPPSGSVNRTQWHHLSITTTPGTNGWKMYQNAILLTQVTGLNSVYIDANTYIGKSYGTYYLNGSLDEIRISSTERSAGWIQNEYNNQNSPSAFYEIGASEENPNVTPTPTNTPTPTSTLTPTPTPTTGPTPTPLPPGSQEMYFEGVDLEGLDIF